MNLIQQCKAMLTPRGQIQMSYDRFKNTFGDLGVAKWRAFLMDNNNLPDGTYNGITKLTIDSVYGTYKATGGTTGNLIAKDQGIIMPSSNGDKWQYGFSNWKILPWNNGLNLFKEPSIAMTPSDGITNVSVPGLTTLAEYNAYLAKHPVVLYYYDSSVWNGAIVTADKVYYTNCFYTNDEGDTTMPTSSNQVLDVQGKYHWYGNLGSTISYKEYDADLMIGAGYDLGVDAHHRVNFKNNAYSLDATGLAQFKANELPRAIVWKK